MCCDIWFLTLLLLHWHCVTWAWQWKIALVVQLLYSFFFFWKISSYILMHAWICTGMYHAFSCFKISSIWWLNEVIMFSRIDEDELRRFYSTAKGDLSFLLSSVKRTIRWRETYYLLSLQELENWSALVFWHGFDVMLRPCLVVRLGVAMSNLLPHDRPRFSQAIGINFFQHVYVGFTCLCVGIGTFHMIGFNA